MMSPTEPRRDLGAPGPGVRPALAALTAASVLCGMLLGCNQAAAPCFPKRGDHFLYDEAGWLDRDDAARVERALRELYDRYELQFAVVVTQDLCGKSVAQYANELGDAWGVGSASKDNGVVLVVVPKRPGHKGRVFLAPGRGIQDRLPDIRAKRITRDLMVPHFKNGDRAGGILAGIAAVAQALGYPPPAAAAGVAPGKAVEGRASRPPGRAKKGRHRRRSAAPPFVFFVLPFVVGVILGGLARGASSRRRKMGLFALAPVLGAGLSTGVATMTSGDDIDLGAAVALSGALAAFAFLFGMAPGGGTRSGPVVLGGGSSSSGGGGGGIGWGGGGFNGGGAGSDW